MPEPREIPSDFELPPANFSFLVESIMMQTQMQLGIFSMDETDEPSEPNLPIARHSIDLLAALQDKTRGNLTAEEQRLIENCITELRFRYIQVSEELNAKQPKVEPAAETAGKPLIITADGGKGIKSA
jgi:hypothetical protein